VSNADVNALLSTRSLPAIVVHGGAWVRDTEVEPAVLAGVSRAAAAGFAVLKAGGTALDAVEAAAVVLEDDPTFNAGYGSCLTHDGTVELDAAIMRGDTLDAGSVASIHSVRNPVRLARRVMNESGHLMLSGEGAVRFAREIGEEMVAPDWHITPAQRARWEELHREVQETKQIDRRKLGTIGAVAVDLQGGVAAATSTGGTIYKRPGRVGDTPIIGAGTYANNESAAVSCTGHGESFIKLVIAKWAADAVQRGQLPVDAARAAAAYLRERVNGDGGLIIAAPDGRCGWAMNTPKMSRAFMRAGMEAPIAMV
jgi:beta-aspartyl-peptidase (threonine type)